jgi:hypothetical protein
VAGYALGIYEDLESTSKELTRSKLIFPRIRSGLGSTKSAWGLPAAGVTPVRAHLLILYTEHC